MSTKLLSYPKIISITGKSLSEALNFASTNPQYDNILFIELQVQYVKIPSSEHGENMMCTEIDFDIQIFFFVLNMFSPSSAKLRASDKDLPVLQSLDLNQRILLQVLLDLELLRYEIIKRC